MKQTTSPRPWRIVSAPDLCTGYRVVDRRGKPVGGNRANSELAVRAVNALAKKTARRAKPC